MTSLVLVSRLRLAYWPDWCAGIRLRDVLRAEPISKWLAEGSKRRNSRYDHGRIRHFMDQLEAGRLVDPIEVETVWSWPHGHPYGLEIYDGHHRFMAAVFLRRRRIQAQVGGLVDLREWLVGERRRWPL